jgi:hypothetical protein
MDDLTKFSYGRGGRGRTYACGSQSPEPYHLATPLCVELVDTVGVKPTTPCVQSMCSLTELRAHSIIFIIPLLYFL